MPSRCSRMLPASVGLTSCSPVLHGEKMNAPRVRARCHAAACISIQRPGKSGQRTASSGARSQAALPDPVVGHARSAVDLGIRKNSREVTNRAQARPALAAEVMPRGPGREVQVERSFAGRAREPRGQAPATLGRAAARRCAPLPRPSDHEATLRADRRSQEARMRDNLRGDAVAERPTAPAACARAARDPRGAGGSFSCARRVAASQPRCMIADEPRPTTQSPAAGEPK